MGKVFPCHDVFTIDMRAQKSNHFPQNIVACDFVRSKGHYSGRSPTELIKKKNQQGMSPW